MAAVRILMLGDCTLATTYLPAALKNETRLMEALATRFPHDTISVINEGLDGESAQDLMRRYERTMRRIARPDYVIIRFGVQDRRRYGVVGFRHHLHALCERLLQDMPSVRIVLETGIYVDYPTHYEFDRNQVLQPLYDVVRELAHEQGFPLVDIYERMRRETERGNWDLRVRGYGVVDDEFPVLGAGQDHLHKGDVRWFTNIHPSVNGIQVIADEEAQVLARHWSHTLHVAHPNEHCLAPHTRPHGSLHAVKAPAPPDYV